MSCILTLHSARVKQLKMKSSALSSTEALAFRGLFKGNGIGCLACKPHSLWTGGWMGGWKEAEGALVLSLRSGSRSSNRQEQQVFVFLRRASLPCSGGCILTTGSLSWRVAFSRSPASLPHSFLSPNPVTPFFSFCLIT